MELIRDRIIRETFVLFTFNDGFFFFFRFHRKEKIEDADLDLATIERETERQRERQRERERVEKKIKNTILTYLLPERITHENTFKI